MTRAPVVVLAYSSAALALAVQWSAAKVALATAPPLELSTVRFAIAAVTLLPLAFALGAPFPLRRWRPVLAAAACGFLGFNALAFLGLRLTPASDSALIIPTTIPVATALLATIIREPLTTRKAIGFGVATLGAAVLIVGGQPIGGDLSGTRVLGDLLEVAGAICWAACLTVSAVVVRGHGVLGFVAMATVLGAVMLAPLGFVEHGYADLPSWPREVWLAAAILGLLSTSFAFLIFFWAVSRFGAGLAALVSYLAPPAGLAVAFVVLGERPMPMQLFGALVILAGVRIAVLRPRVGTLKQAVT